MGIVPTEDLRRQNSIQIFKENWGNSRGRKSLKYKEQDLKLEKVLECRVCLQDGQKLG